ATSLDVFENKKWLTARTHARIEKPCNRWMSETTERRSLSSKTCLSDLADECEVQQLHGRCAFVAAITATRQPHASHSAVAELTPPLTVDQSHGDSISSGAATPKELFLSAGHSVQLAREMRRRQMR